MHDKTIGDYKVIKQMGEGALGATYLVEHRFVKKQYILKLLPEELSQNQSFLQRFEAQIGRIASLEHPNIVKVHNVSLIDGFYFLVTDGVVNSLGESTNLAEMMANHKEELSEEELFSILTQIAAALDYAHAKSEEESFVHGSLKLSNILVNREDGKLKISLSDFGLMSIVGQNAVVGRSFKRVAEELGSAIIDKRGGVERYHPFPIEARHLSKQSQSFLQTYAFLAPEQKRMEPPTIKSDIYAFAVLTYYLLTGFFPEGFFSMPSEINKKYKFDFDHLIRSTLAFDLEKRPAKLLPLLQPPEEVRYQVEVPLVLQESMETEGSTAFEGVKKSVEAFVSSYLPPRAQIAAPNTNVSAVATMTVAAKNVSESTATVLNPPKDENYAQALKSMLHREPVVTHYQPEKRYTDNLEPLPTEMVVIQGGHFVRGSQGGARDEMPKHQIFLKSFAMDVHPITNEQFLRFIEYMGCEKDEQYNDLIRLRESRLNRVGGNLSIESGYARHPVVGVTWYGAVAYAKWVHKRLPTEAEWEAAASGGLVETLYSTGMSIEKSQANFFSSDTTVVKSYAPNAFGLYDIAGNVYEWCQDWYGYNYYEVSQQEPNQPLGPLQGVYRVLRGGCWKSLKDDLRIAHRHRNNPGTVNGTYGFRCAKDV